MIKSLLLVGFGGFLGSISRFYINHTMEKLIQTPFPYGTFIANVLGCFIIGLIYGSSLKGQSISLDTRLFFTTGFCGGFTTFSTFSLESLNLFQNGQIFHFFIYTSLSILLGFAATFLGILIMK